MKKKKNYKKNLKKLITKSKNAVRVYGKFFGMKLLIAYNHPARFACHSYCGSGDKCF